MAADAREVAETYFAAIGARDLDRIASCWAPDGVDNIVGQADAHGPDGVRTYFAELFAAVPDFALAVDDVLADGRSRRRALARRRARSPATPPTRGSRPPAVASS